MEKLYKLLSRPVSAAIGIVLIILFLVLVLPDQSAKAREYTPENASFDTAFFSPPSEVYSKAARYSEEGRMKYIKARWTFDLLFPISYTFFCLTALAFTTRLLFKEKLKWLLIFPLIAFTFDIAENSFVTAVMNTLANPVPALAWAVSVSTIVKWIFVSLSFGGAVLGLLSSGVIRLMSLFSK